METENLKSETAVEVEDEEKISFERKILWTNVLKYAILHLFGLYGLLLSVTTCKVPTLITTFVLMYLSGLGATAGSHRLWSHRSYKAKWPLRLLLGIFHTIFYEKTIYDMAIDHRVHHKYSETISDPHNINEGFFFSHFGWRMLSSRPEFLEKIPKIDDSDLLNDPIVVYQKRFWIPLVFILSFLLPSVLPFLLWNEDIFTAFCICGCLRWMTVVHIKWTVNSVAHRWGAKTYDKTNGNACDNKIMNWASFGEGFHNFHHAFPIDYKTAEFDWKYNMSLTTAFIDFFALFGWAYDLKTVSPEMIEARRKRTGEPLDPNCEPRRRNVFEWLIVIIFFILPLLCWIFVHFVVNYTIVAIFQKPMLWNIHDYVFYYFLLWTIGNGKEYEYYKQILVD